MCIVRPSSCLTSSRVSQTLIWIDVTDRHLDLYVPTPPIPHTHTHQMFGEGAAEDLFSPDWKHREAALALISRESISYLLPLVTAKFQSRPDPGVGGTSAHSVQEVCMKVVAHTAHDVVLKVFLAALVSGWGYDTMGA